VSSPGPEAAGAPPVGPRQRDAIREIANIGAGHAATALSQMTGLTVMISVPRILWVEDGAGGTAPFRADEEVVAISVQLLGEDVGPAERAALVISRPTAERMVGLLLGRETVPGGELGALERSTLQELGNIVCASYVGVLGSFLGTGVMIGPPRVETGGTALGLTPESGLLIETDFTFRDASFDGLFMLSHSEMSFNALLHAIGVGQHGTDPV
jgi:chemotaxis protein CheC